MLSVFMCILLQELFVLIAQIGCSCMLYILFPLTQRNPITLACSWIDERSCSKTIWARGCQGFHFMGLASVDWIFGVVEVERGGCKVVIVSLNTYTAKPVCWNGWISDSYCSLKPLCSGMGEVVPARTSPTLLPPSPLTVLSLSSFKVSQCINCRDWHCKS